MDAATDNPACLRKRRQRNLNRLLRPRHIAFVGGSQAAGSLTACQRNGFEGHIWTVNPVRDDIGGVPCVPHVEDLPEAPDAVLLAMSPERTVEAVKALSAMGAGGASCVAAGFLEAGAEGATLQAALIEAAGDMALLGPNCMGFINQFDAAVVWGTDNHVEIPDGPGAAIISQSGALVYGVTNVERAFPLGYAISTGNQANTDTADCIESVLDDERVRAIGLYIEGLEDGAALGAACWRALQQGIPVIAIKGGDTPAGEAVAMGHTGAMVVERDLWQAFADRYGIIEVSSPKAMVETLKLLTIGGVPKGNRLSTVTYSGGLNGVIAARAPAMGLELTQPTPENAERLKKRMPPSVPISNPLDLNIPFSSSTGGMSLADGDSIAEGIIDLARDASDMVALIMDVPWVNEIGMEADWLPTINCIQRVRDTLGIPTVASGIMPEGLELNLRQKLLEQGVAPLCGFTDTMEALSVAATIGGIQRAKQALPEPGSLLNHGGRPDGSKARMLDEATSKDRLQPFGLEMPARWAGPCAKAAEAADRLGYPVAVKVVSDTIAHKARVGGVKLGLTSASDVMDAVNEISDAVATSPDGHPVEQVIVERMIADPLAEYIIGIKRHPALGIALMVGKGGTAVENLRQYTTVLLPLEDSDIEAAMECIGLNPGDTGFEAFSKAVRAIAAVATEYSDTLISLDVNPVMITATGDAIAADALVIMAEDT